MSLAAAIKAEARALGFARAGILPVGPSRTHGFYEAWLAQGFAGEMDYLARHREPKRDPGLWMEGARSLICLAMPYGGAGVGRASPPAQLTPRPPLPSTSLRTGPEERGSLGPSAIGTGPLGRISRYAWGRDYHDVIGERLERLAAFIQQRIQQRSEQPLRYRKSVDAQPLMEREWAARAGLGWVGKNALLIDWELGSYLFLAELLVDIELEYDVPTPRSDGAPPYAPAHTEPPSHFREPGAAPADSPGPQPVDLQPVDLGLRESCGSCRACIDACPTQAIVADKTVDARRCISYLTIELKGPIPAELRRPMGDWVFGCDICQDVCPWNRRAPDTGESADAGDALAAFPSLLELLGLDEEGFRARYRRSPLWRTRRRGLARNAAIALGNAAPGLQGDARAQALGALEEALRDPEPVVRGAAAWALGRFVEARARHALEQARGGEGALMVRQEIGEALAPPIETVNQEHLMDPRTGKPLGTILSIHTAAAAGAPMASHPSALAVKGKGIAGDRYSAGTGTYSNKPGVDRELTLIEAEVLEALEREQGIALRPEESRRNLVTRGIALNPLVGLVFRVGDVKLKAVRLCEPCGYLQKLTGKEVFEPLKGRGGLRAQILAGGTIRVGDTIEALTEAQAEPVDTPSRR